VLRAGRRRSARKLLKRGFVVKLELDEPSSVTATLHTGIQGKNGKRRRVLAAAQTSVAVSGLVAMKLEPSRGAGPLLRRRRRETFAKLTVTAVDMAGNRSVSRRRVRVAPLRR
jgi:hypothetical protein